MDIEANYDEVRSIIEAAHCNGCEDEGCDFDLRIDEIMDRLIEYDREVS